MRRPGSASPSSVATDGTGRLGVTRPTASLSLDLDNLWAYQMTHGDPDWEKLGSYLDEVVPIALDVLAGRQLTVTFFVVGKDAAVEANRPVLSSIAGAGHEIGNHSFHHRPWLHQLSESDVRSELTDAEDAIADATGQRPRGFRGPGYSLSPATLRVLAQRGYAYDCSTLPTFIGPLARAYYFRSAQLDPGQNDERRLLFGSWTEGLRPLTPYRWSVGDRTVVELPVTTFPLLRVPIHISYLLYLDGVHPQLAKAYFRAALPDPRPHGGGTVDPAPSPRLPRCGRCRQPRVLPWHGHVRRLQEGTGRGVDRSVPRPLRRCGAGPPYRTPGGDRRTTARRRGVSA